MVPRRCHDVQKKRGTCLRLSDSSCDEIQKKSNTNKILSFVQVGLAVVNGQLMAVGGFDGTTYLKTIEVYDPDANTWR